MQAQKFHLVLINSKFIPLHIKINDIVENAKNRWPERLFKNRWYKNDLLDFFESFLLSLSFSLEFWSIFFQIVQFLSLGKSQWDERLWLVVHGGTLNLTLDVFPGTKEVVIEKSADLNKGSYPVCENKSTLVEVSKKIESMHPEVLMHLYQYLLH